jgi:hypothetical protein
LILLAASTLGPTTLYDFVQVFKFNRITGQLIQAAQIHDSLYIAQTNQKGEIVVHPTTEAIIIPLLLYTSPM